MKKYRFVVDMDVTGEFFFVEVRVLLFFWIYKQGSLSRDKDKALKYFEYLLSRK